MRANNSGTSSQVLSLNLGEAYRRSSHGIAKWRYVANNAGALTRTADCCEVNDRQSGVNAARGSARSHRRGFVLHL